MRYQLSPRSRFLLASGLLSVVALVNGAPASAQVWTYQQRDVATPAPQGLLTAVSATPSTAVCFDNGAVTTDHSIPDGGFVKQYSMARADIAASISGLCDWYMWGSYYATETRNIAYARVTHYPVTLLASFQNVYNQTPAQTLDTRVPGTTSGPVSASFSEVGQYRTTFRTTAHTTSCPITPTDSSVVEIKVNVIACTPEWWLLANAPAAGKPYHVPATTINIFIPSTMSTLYGTPQNPGPADLAIADWNTLLAGTGITFELATQSCGTGGNCVNVVEGPVATGCAEAETGNYNSDGLATSPSTIRLPSAYTSRTADRNRRTLAHEIGHLLGLADNSCAAANSVMGVLACDATSGFNMSPSVSDKLPTTNSTYGNSVRKVCSWY